MYETWELSKEPKPNNNKDSMSSYNSSLPPIPNVNEVDSISIETELKINRIEQSLLLIYCVIFESPQIHDLNSNISIISIGAEACFDEYISKWIADHPYDGVVKVKYIYLKEDSIFKIKDKISNIKCDITNYSTNSNITNIDIQFLVPYNNMFTLYTSILKYILNINCEYSPIIREIIEKTFGKPIIIESQKVKILGFQEIILEDILNIKEELSVNQSSYIPKDLDAQVAAVLCEYTYYLCRTYEDKEVHGNVNDVVYIKKDSKENRDKRKKIWLGRDRSITYRRNNTRDEIFNLYIIPENWKLISDFNDGYKLNRFAPIPCSNAMKVFYDELDKWDAINPELNGWIGMRKYKDNNHKQEMWNKSLSKKIADRLLKNKKFALNENKGILNSWFGFCRYSGIGSIIYVNEDSKTIMYCTAGSDFSNPLKGEDFASNGDWMTTNFLQFFTGLSPQYQQSVTNAKILDEIVADIEKEYKCKLFFIGHSLGGGLASNNAIITQNRHAITFNAAGLNWLRVPISLLKNNPSQLLHPIKRRERVHLFVINGELLDTIQGTVTPLPWKLNNLLYNALPYQTKGYSSLATRKIIDSQICSDLAGKHSMTNFLVPPEHILKIKI